MAKNRAVFVVFVTAALAVAALAPGCRKSEAKLDLSNPRAAAISFTRALERGDAATARQAAQFGGLEGDFIDSMAVLASGVTRLRAAASAKFGAEALHKIEPGATADVSTRLTEANLKLDGDVATLTPTDGTTAMRLTRSGDQWKVDVGALIRGGDVTRLIPAFKAMGEASREVAGDIESGKLTSIDAARDALQQGVVRRLQPAAPAATATPSTSPATTVPTIAPATAHAAG